MANADNEKSTGQKAKEAINTAISTAKAAAYFTSGNLVGAAKEAVKAIPGLVKALLVLLSPLIFVVLLICAVIGVIASSGTYIKYAFSGYTDQEVMDDSEWDITKQYKDDFEPQILSMYKKAYYKECNRMANCLQWHQNLAVLMALIVICGSVAKLNESYENEKFVDEVGQANEPGHTVISGEPVCKEPTEEEKNSNEKYTG